MFWLVFSSKWTGPHENEAGLKNCRSAFTHVAYLPKRSDDATCCLVRLPPPFDWNTWQLDRGKAPEKIECLEDSSIECEFEFVTWLWCFFDQCQRDKCAIPFLHFSEKGLIIMHIIAYIIFKICMNEMVWDSNVTYSLGAARVFVINSFLTLFRME